MALTGQQLIAGNFSNESSESFRAINPKGKSELDTDFYEATENEINQALEAADNAWSSYRTISPATRADFLEKVADNIVALGDELIHRAMAESGLPEARLVGERGRTVGQLKAFAAVVRDGSWLTASIDTALPDREPLPKPDIRRMQVSIGPVIIFGASNFPLAFSVAGGDTASALAAGNPVVVKGHEGHPGTSELVAKAISDAAVSLGIDPGVISLVQGRSYTVGQALVKHPLAQAVGFTGSLRAGRALFDSASARPNPIPVYAEMGSINPIFILPGAMAERGDALAAGLAGSVALGVGQFCTNPGVVISEKSSDQESFIAAAKTAFEEIAPATMLHPGIKAAYDKGCSTLTEEAELLASSSTAANDEDTEAAAALYSTDAKSFNSNDRLTEEVFGPSTLLVSADSKDEILKIAANLDGNLTATIHGTEADLEAYSELVNILNTKVGRIVFNGFPTGVEVCPSMQHGGPYPACSVSNSTSVGAAAITRFSRPVAYQSFPQSALPDELKDSNPLGIWRLVNNELSKDSV
ncbi:MAG: aldehyde dehydrogenase (NADP(+)) [Lentisphaeria bacterium]|nr:aldehyde dehydrogenase (NADP(+)) [Lentisphaeria bacterium]NQZ67864.1 aldehyde dehydrogenase (NADP(+)) [Lentisphaeria bacterium]